MCSKFQWFVRWGVRLKFLRFCVESKNFLLAKKLQQQKNHQKIRRITFAPPSKYTYSNNFWSQVFSAINFINIFDIFNKKYSKTFNIDSLWVGTIRPNSNFRWRGKITPTTLYVFYCEIYSIVPKRGKLYPKNDKQYW